MERGKTGLT